MNEIVERHNGVIVQYLGDSVYAMWNAPTPDPSTSCRLPLHPGAPPAVDEFNAATAWRAGRRW